MRNRFRTTLTVFGVAIAVLAFIMLRTVVWAYNIGVESAAPDRIVTRHKVTFVMWLPKRYIDTVRQEPGVKMATWASWFGGKDPKHEQEFFSTLAVDAETYFDVYNDCAVKPAELAAFKENRRGAIVGDAIAKKMNWKVGDRIALKSQIFPGDWEFAISGIYTATRKSVDRSTFLFHWNYLNEGMPSSTKDKIGWIVTKVSDPARTADMSLAIDRKFDDRDTQTLSQSEGAFNAGFLGMFTAVLKAIDIVSIIIMLIMMLILGNTIAMGARERTQEYGALRAIGFLPRHLAVFVLGESFTIGVLGGIVGLALSYPIVQLGMGRFLEENMGSFFPYFRISGGNALLAVALAVGMSLVAAGIPAWSVTRLRVVDALRRVA